MERDEESGLDYHTARYYLASLSRWVSSDPAGLNGGANLHCYCSNNPIALLDTEGRQPTNWELYQQKALRQPVRATATDRGITPEHRLNFQILGKQWGVQEPIQVGHVKPFGITPAGEVGDTFAQPRSENASQGAADKRAKAEATSSGKFGRAGDVDTTVQKGTRFGPRPSVPEQLQGLKPDPKPLPTPTSGRDVKFTVETPAPQPGKQYMLDLRGPTSSKKPSNSVQPTNLSFDFDSGLPPVKSQVATPVQLEMNLQGAATPKPTVPAPNAKVLAPAASPTQSSQAPHSRQPARPLFGKLAMGLGVVSWMALVSQDFDRRIMTPVTSLFGELGIRFANWRHPATSQQAFIDGQLDATGMPSDEDLKIMRSIGFTFDGLSRDGARMWSDNRLRRVH